MPPIPAALFADIIVSELSHPSSPWLRQFPSTPTLAEVFGVDLDVVDQALALITPTTLRALLTPATAPDSAPRRSRAAPLPHVRTAENLATVLTGHIRLGGLRELPPHETLAALFGVHTPVAEQALQMLRTRGLITPITGLGARITGWRTTSTQPAASPVTATIPGITVTATTAATSADAGASPAGSTPTHHLGPDEHTIARELMRRIHAGWYHYTALDGTRRGRPFPTVNHICMQFRCGPTPARLAVEHLALLRLIPRPLPASPPSPHHRKATP